MAEKKTETRTKKTEKNTKPKESKWMTGKGVPVDGKKIKWANKY